MRVSLYQWGAFLLGVGLFFSCRQSDSPSSQPAEAENTIHLSPDQIKGASIEVKPLVKQRVCESVRLIGRTMVLAHSQGKAHTPLPGMIRAILIREGQYVQAGQELFRIYSSAAIDLQRQYAETHARWRAARLRLAMQESLAVRNLISQTDFQQALSELRQIETQLRALRSQLDLIGLSPDTTGEVRLLSIRAPLGGYITHIAVNMGEFVRPEQPLAHIVNLHDIHADLYISERELAWLREGMPVELYLPGLPQAGKLLSKIEYIAQVEDTAGAHLLVHVRLPRLDYPIFAGTPIEGRIERERGEAFVLPREALGYHAGQAYIFVEKDPQMYEALPVKVSFLDSLALVEGAGLQPNLRVVQRGAAFLASALWQVERD